MTVDRYPHAADNPTNRIDPSGASDTPTLGCDLGTAFGLIGGSELLAGGGDMFSLATTGTSALTTALGVTEAFELSTGAALALGAFGVLGMVGGIVGIGAAIYIGSKCGSF